MIGLYILGREGMRRYSFYESPEIKRAKPVLQAIAKDDSEFMIEYLNIHPDLIYEIDLDILVSNSVLNSIFDFAFYFNAIKCLDILDKNALLKINENCMYAAAAGGSVEILKLLKFKPEQLLDNALKIANTAAKFGNLEMLMHIFTKAGLNYIENVLTHPIYNAAKYNQIKCLEFLIKSIDKSQMDNRFLNTIAQATTELKAEDSLVFLCNTFTSEESRKILYKYIIQCDALELFKKEFDISKITPTFSDLIINNNSIRILRYLIESGANVPRSSAIGRSSVSREIKEIYFGSDPMFYINAGIRNPNDSTKVSMAVQALDYITDIDMETAYRAAAKLGLHAYRKILEKVPDKSAFKANLAVYFVSCGETNPIGCYSLLKDYAGDPVDLLKYAKNELTQQFIIANGIIKDEMIDANFCKKVFEKDYNFTLLKLLSKVDLKKLTIDLLEKKEYPYGFFRYLDFHRKKLKRDEDILNVLRRDDQEPPGQILGMFNTGLCHAVRHYFQLPAQTICEEDIGSSLQIYKRLNDKERKEILATLDQESAEFFQYVEKEQQDLLEDTSPEEPEDDEIGLRHYIYI